MPTLIDEFLPRYDVVERHAARVRAPATTTYAALRTADLGSSWLVRLLLGLRALPGAIRGGWEAVRALTSRRHSPITLAALVSHGFRVVAERPDDELLLGIEGRFWVPSGAVCADPADDFRHAQASPGTARAIWNFRVRAIGDGLTEVTTETRVQCADTRVRLRFLPYWMLVRAGSGLIRRSMLQSVRKAAERERGSA